ncbi:hypothetical protein V2S66_24235 [Streptomyces sp. V4-01]|uniref:Uncharacterized protein n=1 Tax=Actinacidiphila polyblastidii TaxID=3110430 RepID=A0ABU7PGW6_9ACTN|nr:hypothetical protein [Streptomyces sp. V4-01]
MPFHSDETPEPTEAAAFTHVLHQAGDGLTPADSRALAAAGFSRGRTLRRRRTAMLTAGAAVLAIAGTSGVLAAVSGHDGGARTGATGTGVAAAPDLSGGTRVAQASATTAAAPRSFTARQVEDLLISQLPHGKISGRVGRGTDDVAPYAHVVYDDGHGAAAVEVVVQAEGEGLEDCAPIIAAGDSCTQNHVHGGTLTILKTWEYPDHRTDTKEWLAEFVRDDGSLVSVSEWNAPAEKDAPVSRPAPPLSTARLAAIATDRSWAQVIAAIPPGVK